MINAEYIAPEAPKDGRMGRLELLAAVEATPAAAEVTEDDREAVVVKLDTRRGKTHFAATTCDTRPENSPAEGGMSKVSNTS